MLFVSVISQANRSPNYPCGRDRRRPLYGVLTLRPTHSAPILHRALKHPMNCRSSPVPIMAGVNYILIRYLVLIGVRLISAAAPVSP